ncbi:MAG TPA: SBBP repeat-containing protein [Terriglobia bacterium]|nr:SBBP repeat-containing protein [Terriglobia bacterium]
MARHPRESGEVDSRLRGNDRAFSLAARDLPGAMDKGPRTTESVLRMKLVGANAEASVTGADELPGKSNYFVGNDPKKWRTNVPNYAKVRYRDVYPGVDLVYYGNQGQLEHDFVVSPGSDPKVIRLAISGARKFDLDQNGDLKLGVPGGDVTLKRPHVYQDVEGVRREIRASYVLMNRREFGFRLGGYDSKQPLVIDPVLIYSTYLGGSGLDVGNAIAVDSFGNVYVAGSTESANFPTTAGAFQTTYGGGVQSAFVSKLNPAGSALVYSTYLGGSNQDVIASIAVDSLGNAYVTGSTYSSDFPTTTGAFQAAFGGGTDAFVTKLSLDGSALVYSTYLGGNSYDLGNGIAVDSFGSVYVTGYAESANFPTTAGAFQTTFGGGVSNAFVTKLNPTGSALVYSTYLGGSNIDRGDRIALDSSGNAYVTGDAESTNFPTTAGAFQTTFGGGVQDAFVTKLNPAGSALVYSTYLGGSGRDVGLGIAVDSIGNAYVTGYTESTDFPTTTGAFQTTYVPAVNDYFVTKLNSTGAALLYSTFLGGQGGDYEGGQGIGVDSLGNAYVTGGTTSSLFPTTAGAPQTSFGGAFRDAVVFELNPAGSALVYSTYLGGSGDDYANGIAVDSSGNAYVTGSTQSSDFPTASPFQAANAGGYDAFVAKISNPPPGNTPTGTNVSVALGGGDTVTGGVSLTFSSVTTAGNTTLTTSGTGAPPPAGFQLGNPPTYFQLSTTAVYSGPITICINYSGISFHNPANLKLFQIESGIPVNVTTSNNTATMIICGSVSTLSPFAIFEAVPLANLSPASLTFAAQVISSTSAPQAVTLTNAGAATLNISSVAISGDFAQSNTCGASVAANGNCAISATFTPTLVGSRTGTVTITDDAGGSPQSISLSGTGEYGICALYDQTKAVKGGAVFPIKVMLCDANGNDVSSSSVVLHATAVTMVSSYSGIPDTVGNANPDNDFRFDTTLGPTGGYIFNLSTNGLASGTYSLQFTATGDPVGHAVIFGVK